MKIGPVLLIAMLFFAGCSKQPPPRQFDQLKLSYTPYQKPMVQRQIPIVFVQVDGFTMNESQSDGSMITYGQHWLCFANYDVSENPDRPNTKILQDVPPGSDIEPIKACLMLNDKEGTTASAPLLPGTYFIGTTKNMTDRIVEAGIFWDKGKLGSQTGLDLAKMKGQLKLDSVSEDEFSGEIDLSDGENLIAGTFNGKAKIKKYK
ncbi:MAG TPA: hypothetical protein VHS05_12665 [Pyrinomonadaceae bacterium]|jgi:hypothetical protein|nr:hypothetical protein [Pyrinomonadaceae bacterium]